MGWRSRSSSNMQDLIRRLWLRRAKNREVRDDTPRTKLTAFCLTPSAPRSRHASRQQLPGWLDITSDD